MDTKKEFEEVTRALQAQFPDLDWFSTFGRTGWDVAVCGLMEGGNILHVRHWTQGLKVTLYAGEHKAGCPTFSRELFSKMYSIYRPSVSDCVTVVRRFGEDCQKISEALETLSLPARLGFTQEEP